MTKIKDYITRISKTYSYQLKTYYKYSDQCDWFIILDVDEYIDTPDIYRIDEYVTLPRYKICNGIKIPWMHFDDNELLYYDNRTVLERFPRITMNTYDFPKKCQNVSYAKNFIRAKMKSLKYWDVHKIEGIEKGCDNEGKPYSLNNILVIKKYNGLYERHYFTKSVWEYFYKKKIRGDIVLGNNVENHEKIIKQLKRYFALNRKTIEKIKLFEKLFNTSLSELV